MNDALLHAAATDVGRRRDHNEDAILDTPPLFAVADGVGGAAKGEVASSTALDVFTQAGGDVLNASDSSAATAAMIDAVLRCNNSVHAAQAEEPDRAGMATTLTAAVLRPGGEVVLGHVGDSRAYAIDGGGEVRQLTDDHSLVGELVRAGQMSPEEASSHPQRNVITRALGPEADVEVDAFVTTMRPGEWLLLCSDGLTGHVRDDELGQAIVGAGSPDAAVRDLVTLANERGGSDNISVVLVRPLPPDIGSANHSAADGTVITHPTAVDETGELDLRPIEATDAHEVESPTASTAWDSAQHTEVAAPQTIMAVPASPPPPARTRSAAAAGGAAPRARSRYLRRVLVLTFMCVLAFVVGAVAWRQSYFLHEQAGGTVGINQGFPVFGLHREYRSSDVHVDDLEGADREKYVESSTLRSREDAERVFARLPELAGRCDTQTAGAGSADDATLRDPNC